ncbi:hypothetical protein [Halococcus saccharolyticus]|uniref:Uncharacterized protein n=1 Tax=Halococcus saccharolyticus DSM 5350 TaxID=1227455 RepID=M0MR81_9EURY|nr:hypothetical protein [Halococcus saccharolyticus]EMA47868.1 hypothetical protein C449_00310 [Halococcus saccharolyticus DSM 5350]
MSGIHERPVVRIVVGGIATGLFVLFGLAAVGYLLSDGEAFGTVTLNVGLAMAAGALACYEFHAFDRCCNR